MSHAVSGANNYGFQIMTARYMLGKTCLSPQLVCSEHIYKVY